MNSKELWNRYCEYLNVNPTVGVSVDISRMKFADNFFAEMSAHINRAFEQMDELEKGSIVNPDENRMVGHYWLRDEKMAPTAELRDEIAGTLSKIKSFAADIHQGAIKNEKGGNFRNILVIGIGGSA